MHRYRLSAVVLATAVGISITGSPAPIHAQPAPPGWPTAIESEKLPTDVAAAAADARSAQTERSSTDGLVVHERERPNRNGRNDELATAQPVRRLGTGRRDVGHAFIEGAIADVRLHPTMPIGPFTEDDGSIPFANPTGLATDQPSVRATGVIGDGPHGTLEGDGRGDFDLYLVEDAVTGQVLTVDVDAAAIGSGLDAIVAVIDDSGDIIAINDDSPELDSFLQVEIPADGDYTVGVAAFGALPTNPFDSGSGPGARTEGAYELALSYDHTEDVDVYRVDLRAGDVLGASVADGARVLEVFDPSGVLVNGAGRDLSAFYPDDSPLRVAGNATVDHVAAVSGPHYLRVSRGFGQYRVDVRVLRPGLETASRGEHQILFLDFDGAEIDPSTFGTDSGTLSPMTDSMAGWGLGPDDEDALVDAIIATFTENIVDDTLERGGNPRFDVEILNSRDDADPWGQANVSRIVVGGSREELDANVVGLSDTVDPGNFSRQDTAVVLLDQLSAPAESGLATINVFAGPDTDMVAFAGRTLGFVASHEAGHFLGNSHTRPNDGVVSIMDTQDVTQLGLGPDFVFGTADDVDVDFVTDEAIEGIVGAHDTMTRVAFALSSGQRH
ncbi:MAG: hypothetical protein ABW195_10510 [Ilumatobacteraceae bacterium]